MKADAPLLDHEDWTSEHDSLKIDVDGNDLSIVYSDAGSTKAHPVVFIHGIPKWSFHMRRFSPAFKGAYLTVVPDLLGCGNSDRRYEFVRSIQSQEEAVGELIYILRLDTVTLVSHDICGGKAPRYASHQTERVGTPILSNSVCYDTWPTRFVNELSVPDTNHLRLDFIENKLEFAFVYCLYEPDLNPSRNDGMKTPWLCQVGTRAFTRAAVATNTNHTTEIRYEAIVARTYCLWWSEAAMMPNEYGDLLSDDLDGTMVTIDRAYHFVVEDRLETYHNTPAEALLPIDSTSSRSDR